MTLSVVLAPSVAAELNAGSRYQNSASNLDSGVISNERASLKLYSSLSLAPNGVEYLVAPDTANANFALRLV